MTGKANPPLWYKEAIFYGIDVELFQDSDGDGVGDFLGVCQRLDYLADLGVTCLWLLPCFATPNRDNGYDISNYYAVDPRLGTLEDFKSLVRRAGERGLRILLDLVVDHTSDQHPWFQAARQDRQCGFRRYYQWSDAPPPVDPSHGNIFPGEETATWTYDEVAGQYYHHRFYHFMPDLDAGHPEVRGEIKRIMDYWLSFGIAGFRVDAVSHLIESPDTPALAHDAYHILRELRAFASARRADAALLGEADVDPEPLRKFFGDGDQLHLLHNFFLNNYLFLAFAQGQAAPITHALRLLPSIPQSCQWVNFLRNFDELDLERLSEQDRQAVFAAFAPEPGMRIFGRGIRRRLASMLVDQRRIQMAYSLLFTLPGTPLFMYGDEIGMGDDLSLPGRQAVRTAMQWSSEAHGGFSSAGPEALAVPVHDTGPAGYPTINVADQTRDPDSLLNWIKGLIQRRRLCPEWAWGTCRVLETGEPSVFAHQTTWEDRTVLALHNLAEKHCSVRLRLEPPQKDQHLLLDSRQEESQEKWPQVDLEPYGYRWYRVVDR
jgi:maltose alpha-D-glucosyltransferase / alpha-amylase